MIESRFLSVKRVLCLLCLFASFALLSVPAQAETVLSVCINEICASNSGHYTIGDSAPDYVELHNLTDQPLSLDGLFIGDDEDHLQKFTLNGYSIPENGYIILAADKKELPFKLSASGGDELFLSDEEGHILQHVSLPPLGKDETYSLQQNGEWQLTEPSPLSENREGAPYVEKIYVASPRFSHEAGFYDNPFDLTLESYKSYKVYYTTDGSVPDESATLYTGPIHIEDATSNPNTLSMRTDITIDGATPPAVNLKKATVICAVAIDAEGNRSNVVTNTYFVGFQNYEEYRNIPVLSIVGTPAALFDEQDGIYVRGKVYQNWLKSEKKSDKLANRDIPTNYRQRGREWEIPVSIQEFDQCGNLLLSQNVGLRIHGSSTRERVQKSFNLYARTEYGYKDFQAALVPGTEHRKKYVVRINAGIDSTVHELLECMNLPVSKSQPCLCFLNGEFWGFYELREKQDEEYISDCTGVNQDDLIVVKNNHINAGSELAQALGYNVEARGITKELNTFFSGLDTSSPEGYSTAGGIIDIDNYLAYVVGNVFFNNGDFLNNDTFWRAASISNEKYHDGRWRWIYQDMDQCFTSIKYKDALAMLMEKPIFVSLWNNASFRTGFYTLIMDFTNVLFTPDSVQEYVTEKLDYYSGYYRISDERYMESDPGNNDYGKALRKTILDFLADRRDELIGQCKEMLTDKRETHSLTVKELSSDIQLLINSHHACHSNGIWKGVYFSGCEVTFEVNEIPGYRFSGWYDNGSLLTDQTTVTVSTDSDHQLTPAYEAIPDIAVLDKINYARSNLQGGYVLYKRNVKSKCVIVPDTELKSTAGFESISLTSPGNWEKGTGFTITFPTEGLSSCGMILCLTVPDGCPKLWDLFSDAGDGKNIINCDLKAMNNELQFTFMLPETCLGLPAVSLHFESSEDCPGGTVQITKIRLYGEKDKQEN